MKDLPTREQHYTFNGDSHEALVNAIEWGMTEVTEPLLTRVEAANAMMAFLNEHGGDVGQHWPTTEDALKWLEARDESA